MPILDIIAGIIFAIVALLGITVQVYLTKWANYLKKNYPERYKQVTGKDFGNIWPQGIGGKVLILAYFTNRLNFDETLKKYSRIYKTCFWLFVIVLAIGVTVVYMLQ